MCVQWRPEAGGCAGPKRRVDEHPWATLLDLNYLDDLSSNIYLFIFYWLPTLDTYAISVKTPTP